MDGLEQMDCIFLGVILSISSTTNSKTLMNWVLSQKFAGIVIGSLIVQDIISHFNDGTVIYSCSKSAIFRNRTLVSVLKLILTMVYKRNIFHSYLIKRQNIY
jgi:CPA2 family monovalent cation:H+ antiporter-2